MSAHPALSDWPDSRRFSELHRSGFTAGTDVAPLDVSRFPPSAAFGDECACEGAAPTASYKDGIRALESDPWVFWAVVVGVIGGAILTAAGVA